MGLNEDSDLSWQIFETYFNLRDSTLVWLISTPPYITSLRRTHSVLFVTVRIVSFLTTTHSPLTNTEDFMSQSWGVK